MGPAASAPEGGARGSANAASAAVLSSQWGAIPPTEGSPRRCSSRTGCTRGPPARPLLSGSKQQPEPTAVIERGAMSMQRSHTPAKHVHIPSHRTSWSGAVPAEENRSELPCGQHAASSQAVLRQPAAEENTTHTTNHKDGSRPARCKFCEKHTCSLEFRLPLRKSLRRDHDRLVVVGGSRARSRLRAGLPGLIVRGLGCGARQRLEQACSRPKHRDSTCGDRAAARSRLWHLSHGCRRALVVPVQLRGHRGPVATTQGAWQPAGP